jgi:hypothetical protein
MFSPDLFSSVTSVLLVCIVLGFAAIIVAGSRQNYTASAVIGIVTFILITVHGVLFSLQYGLFSVHYGTTNLADHLLGLAAMVVGLGGLALAIRNLRHRRRSR